MPIKFWLLAALLATSTAAIADSVADSDEATPASAADLQRAIRAFSGTWRITEKFPSSPVYPRGGTGAGTEVWRAGPGEINLVYEYHATHPDGEMSATAILWWDAEAGKLRELWCTNKSSKGCVLSTAHIRWEGDTLVFTDSYLSNDHLVFSREVWSAIHADEHTMTISESEKIGELKPWIVAHAVRTR